MKPWTVSSMSVSSMCVRRQCGSTCFNLCKCHKLRRVLWWWFLLKTYIGVELYCWQFYPISHSTKPPSYFLPLPFAVLNFRGLSNVRIRGNFRLMCVWCEMMLCCETNIYIHIYMKRRTFIKPQSYGIPWHTFPSHNHSLSDFGAIKRCAHSTHSIFLLIKWKDPIGYFAYVCWLLVRHMCVRFVRSISLSLSVFLCMLDCCSVK